jgi:hypothetical protein
MSFPTVKRGFLYSIAVGAGLSLLLLLLSFCEDALTNRGHDWAHVLDFAEWLQMPGFFVAYYVFGFRGDWIHKDVMQFYVSAVSVNAVVYSVVVFVLYLLAYPFFGRRNSD